MYPCRKCGCREGTKIIPASARACLREKVMKLTLIIAWMLMLTTGADAQQI